MTWISWRNLIAGATVTASKEATNLPASRLLNPVVSERYRAPDLAPAATRVKVDFLTPAAIQPSVAFWQRPRRSAEEEAAEAPSFAATDTMRHMLSTTSGHDGDIYDTGDVASGVATGVGVHCRFLAPAAASTFLSCEFNALSRATFPANFVDWGYAHYGVVDLEPQVDFASPAVFQQQEGAERRFSWDSAALRIRRKQRRRRWRLVFRAIKTPSESSAVEAFLEYAGDGGRFILGRDRTDLVNGVGLFVLDTAAYSRTSRRLAQLDLPLLEAF